MSLIRSLLFLRIPLLPSLFPFFLQSSFFCNGVFNCSHIDQGKKDLPYNKLSLFCRFLNRLLVEKLSCKEWFLYPVFRGFKSLVAFSAFSLNYWTQYIIQSSDDKRTYVIVVVVFRCCKKLLRPTCPVENTSLLIKLLFLTNRCCVGNHHISIFRVYHYISHESSVKYCSFLMINWVLTPHFNLNKYTTFSQLHLPWCFIQSQLKNIGTSALFKNGALFCFSHKKLFSF